MPEVAQALLMPTLDNPELAALLSTALVWDQVLLPPGYVHSDSRLGVVVSRLKAEGIVQFVRLSADGPGVAKPRGVSVSSILSDVLRTPVGSIESRDSLEAQAMKAMREASDEVADFQITRLRSALELCELTGSAPVSGGLLGHIAAALPPPSAGVAAREGALISASTQGAAIDPDTDIDDLLAFRQRHKTSIGRLRASMIDLASTMRADAAPTALLSEAQAVMSNRVEPALADLESALKEGRIRFLWQALFGASAVASAAVAPAAAVHRAGMFATRSLSYAFDRDKMVREHPYGFLHQMRAGFGAAGGVDFFARRPPIQDPVAEMRRIFWVGIEAGFGPEVRKYVDAVLAGEELPNGELGPLRRVAPD